MNHQSKQTKKQRWLILGGSLLLLIVLFFTFTNRYVWRIEGTSMTPTLSPGELALVRHQKKINRYDMVAFKVNEPSLKNIYVVKRVIGMPGDLVEINEQQVLIRFAAPGVKNDEEMFKSQGQIEFPMTINTKKVEPKELIIPENKYFMVGDNVNGSYDSRIFGLIDREQIEGTLLFK